MDWFIPFTGKLELVNILLVICLIPCCAIPPCIVEASVCESCYFCEYIENTFEYNVERKEIEGYEPASARK